MSLVLGLTGKNCAGKDAAADVLEADGFERHSLSDVLRAELRRRSEPVTRAALIALGVELREAEGASVLAERMKAMLATDRACLVSVRSPAEVRSLERLPRFVLVTVHAPQAARFDRERRRDATRGESAPPTLEAFLGLEARENTANENAQQLDSAIALASETIVNDGTLDDLATKMRALVERLDG